MLLQGSVGKFLETNNPAKSNSHTSQAKKKSNPGEYHQNEVGKSHLSIFSLRTRVHGKTHENLRDVYWMSLAVRFGREQKISIF